MPRDRSLSPRRYDKRSQGESSRGDHQRHRSYRDSHGDDRVRKHRDDDRDDREAKRRDHRDRDSGRYDSKHGRSSHSERKRSYDSDEDEAERRERRREKKEQERAARKAAKRAAKEEDEASAQRAMAAEALMYSAEDNPFNDADLSSKFKWRKKEDKEKKQGMSRAEAEARDAERRREAMEEIARLNQKRAEREREQQEREEEEARMARLAESAAMSEWVAKEDDFHLQQSRKRAAIRVREGRAKPIDLLAINLKWADPKVLRDKDSRDRDEGDDEEDDEAGLEIDLEEPYLIFENLSLDEVEELHQDIQMYLTLEKNEQHLDFWKAMVIVCDDKLDELRMIEDGANPQQRSLDPAVRSEMDTMLGNKTHEQLVGLQDQVRSKLKSGESIDVEYWEGLLKQIVVWRAKARLRDQHENVLANRIAYLRKRQRLEAERMQEELRAQMQDGEDDTSGQSEAQPLPTGADADEDQAAEAQAAAAEAELLRIQTEWDETMEPGFIDRNSLPYADRQVAVVDPDEDRVNLLEARRKVLGARFVPRNSGPRHARGEGEDTDASMWKQEASKPMDVEEEAFNNAEELVGKSYQWEDKYRPRKPRYFNRVHTGFEWSRYNQTHYDSVENPPPKVVQGYKFNIFYPDLIDKSKAPTYRIRKDPNDPDTAIIIFVAGPPYEDIAFRIVNKPWNLAHRRGFRASFDRGIMQLYFSFQRNFYRK